MTTDPSWGGVDKARCHDCLLRLWDRAPCREKWGAGEGKGALSHERAPSVLPQRPPPG